MSIMGKRIRQKRQELGLTLEELGGKLGVKASAVNKWENGTVENIKRSTIESMAELFKCSPVWLMGFEDHGPSEQMDWVIVNEDESWPMIEIEKQLQSCDIEELSVLQKYIDYLLAQKQLQDAGGYEMEM